MKDQRSKKTPASGTEQDTDRATSGGGLGLGRELAAGMPEADQEKGSESSNSTNKVDPKADADKER